ncbi:MAG: 50S ribosomal protein L9 [Bdellovibrionaceae bacterium]|nr:50S ribosomal protein L9 [Pseudobdellovibrionaceae bacterium]
MKLILQKDVKNLGKAGDQVSVKDGFARNFLIPKGYGILLNKDRLKTWNHQKIIIEAKKRKAVSERKKIIDQLSSIKLIFEKESQKDNRIFGSVTAHEISQALDEKHNINVDKKDIHFSDLKTVGDHKVKIRLDSEQQTEILLTIKGKIRKKAIENLADKDSSPSSTNETAEVNKESEDKLDIAVSKAKDTGELKKQTHSSVETKISKKSKTYKTKDKPAKITPTQKTINTVKESSQPDVKAVKSEHKKEMIKKTESSSESKPVKSEEKPKKSKSFFKKIFGK